MATSTLAGLLSDPGSWGDREVVARAVADELGVDTGTAARIAATLGARRSTRTSAAPVVAAVPEVPELRRRQATELNDNVVQGLAAAVYALELDDHDRVERYLRQTLAAASQIATDLLAECADCSIPAGSSRADDQLTVRPLRRSAPARLGRGVG